MWLMLVHDGQDCADLKCEVDTLRHGRRFSSDEDGDGPGASGQGDVFGVAGRRPHATRRTKAANWGRSDTASRERQRRTNRDKEQRKDKRKRDAFEQAALGEDHPQICPICMDELKTDLLVNCGETRPPFHRYHGFCEQCADLAVQVGRCPLCIQPITGHIAVGVGFFVGV